MMRFSVVLMLLFAGFTSLQGQVISVVSMEPGASIFAIEKKGTDILGYEKQPEQRFIGIDSANYKRKSEVVLFRMTKPNYRPKNYLFSDKMIRKGHKRVVLDKLDSIPRWQNGQAKLFVSEVNFKIPEKNFRSRSYDEIDDFIAKNKNYSTTNLQEVIVDNSVLDGYLNRFLASIGYLDTINGRNLNLDLYEDVNIFINVVDLNICYSEGYARIDLTCNVEIADEYSARKPVRKDYKAYSNIVKTWEKLSMSDLLEETMENVIINILNDPLVMVDINHLEASYKKALDSVQVINIDNALKDAPSLENAVQSVVTVKLEKGHGSGCIISRDGYGVTNYHVLSNDSSKAEVIFSDGSKKMCRFVRGNPMYDLSLFKIDTIIQNPIRINFEKVSTGSDVYAIGTPKDLSLGQTVTRGIVSGKRTLQNKVYIQSDVSVNGGNSGGAMINKQGELIGIVNAKLIGVGVEGVSFAIPVSYLEEGLKIKILQK